MHFPTTYLLYSHGSWQVSSPFPDTTVFQMHISLWTTIENWLLLFFLFYFLEIQLQFIFLITSYILSFQAHKIFTAITSKNNHCSDHNRFHEFPHFLAGSPHPFFFSTCLCTIWVLLLYWLYLRKEFHYISAGQPQNLMTVCLAEGMGFHTSCKQYQNSSKSDACFYFHQPPTFLTYLFAHSWTGISSSHLTKPISFQLLDLKFIASLYPLSSTAVAPNHPAGVLPIQASHEPENLTLKWSFHFSAATTVTLFNES